MTWAVGLDLSLTSTGWATWGEHASGATHEAGTIKTTANLCMGERLDRVLTRVLELIAEGPVMVVIEDLPTNVQHGGTSLGRVHGALEWALWQAGSGPPVVRLAPATLKKFATGKGNAPKDLMLAEAIKRLGYQGHQNDEVDALWLAAAGAHLCGLDSLPALPQAHVAALKDHRTEVGV